MSPSLIIYGDSSIRDEFVSEGVGIADISEVNFVEIFNRQICRFAYQAVFAQKAGQEQLIQENATLSPVIHFDRITKGKGEIVKFQMVFGKRERKPKWVD